MGKIENEPTYDFVSDLKRCIDNIEIFDKEGFVIEIEEIKKAIDNIYNNYSNDNKKITKPQLLEHESQAGKTIYAFDDAKLRDFMLEKKILEQVDKMINQKLDDFKEELNKEKEINKENFTDFQNIESYNIVSKLKEILEEEKVSQKELCEKTNISRSTLNYILNNPDTISLKNAYKISKILNKPVEDIFDFVAFDVQLSLDDLD